MDHLQWREPRGNEAQSGFLHSFRRRNFYIAGRGSGKSIVLCQKARIYSRMHKGSTFYLTEQTDGDIEDILIPAWQACVPDREYVFKSAKRGINVLMANGSVGKFRSRQAKRVHSDPPFRGPSGVGYIGHDEIAQDTRADVPRISMGMQRGANVPFYVTDYTTTPKPNWFYAYAKKFGVAAVGKRIQTSVDGNTIAFYGRTADNRYNDNLDEKMRSEGLSEQEVLQELEGWFASYEGLCWKSFSHDPFPYGNIWDGGFVHGQPWILGVDHGGANGAWLIFQSFPARHFPGNVIVLMAEYTPGGPAYKVIQEIKQRFGSPYRCYVGADHVTPGNTGDTAEMLFAQHGWTCDVVRMTNAIATKDQQGAVLAAQILNTMGERRFLVSNKLESYYPGETRGVMDLLVSDTYSTSGIDLYRKEKDRGIYHEDTRDALLYTFAGMFPPTWDRYTKWAK